MPAGFTPRSVETSVAKLRISSPAPSSRTSERATSATTRPCRIQPCLWPAPAPLPDSFIPLARSWREAFHAGTMPTISVVTTASARLAIERFGHQSQLHLVGHALPRQDGRDGADAHPRQQAAAERRHRAPADRTR